MCDQNHRATALTQSLDRLYQSQLSRFVQMGIGLVKHKNFG
mgnify:CR=1 FL=1